MSQRDDVLSKVKLGLRIHNKIKYVWEGSQLVHAYTANLYVRKQWGYDSQR